MVSGKTGGGLPVQTWTIGAIVRRIWSILRASAGFLCAGGILARRWMIVCFDGGGFTSPRSSSCMCVLICFALLCLAMSVWYVPKIALCACICVES